MKKILLISILSIALFNSCRKDKDDEPVDPCDITNVKSSKVALYNFMDFNNGYIGYDPNGNPAGAQNNDIEFEGVNIQAKNGATIFDDGASACLGLVEKRSNVILVTEQCEINHGYLVKLNDGSYARFYIAESIIGAGGIEGYRVYWQYPYSNY